MSPKDVIRYLLSSNDFLVMTYLNDLSDADLLTPPGPGANPVAWQLGHLIQSEQSLLKDIPGTTPIELPAGWADMCTPEKAKSGTTTGYLTKAQYLDHYQRSRANVLKSLDAIPEADLGKPTPGRLAAIAPKLGDMFTLIANHPMMHVGQIVVLRRKLGKPIVI